MSDDQLLIPVAELARDMWARVAQTFHTSLRFDPQWHVENDHSITW